MRRKSLWRLSIRVDAEAEEAVAELIGEVLDLSASSYTHAESSLTEVTAFLDSKQLWSETVQHKLRAGLKRIANCGVSIAPGRIAFRKLPSRDWAHAWKHHFKPIRVGTVLLVRPSWTRLRVRKGQKVVVIDPGLSFGTGHHPTTRFCLQQLVAHRGLHESNSLLDLGTGSGILAIAAAKLGYATVSALDFDPDALAVACENARRNHVASRIVFQRKDIAMLPKPLAQRYFVICANLLTPLLLSERARILAHLDNGGVLVLAGILKSEFKPIESAYTSTGLKLVASRVEREWCSGTFADCTQRPS